MATTPQNGRTEKEVLATCRFELDLETWNAFNRTLDRPAQVKPRLQRLFAESTVLE